jgi:hypothetical protein
LPTNCRIFDLRICRQLAFATKARGSDGNFQNGILVDYLASAMIYSYFINPMSAKDPILPEYLETLFIVNDENVVWPQEFWIITACNPYSHGDSSGDAAADRRLRKMLSRSGCWKVRIKGISPDWKHGEKSFAFTGLALSEVLELGREFQQNAVFNVKGDILSVVACDDSRVAVAGSFRERIRRSQDRPSYRVYVIRLDPAVLQVKRFKNANPNHTVGKPCYYVGMTSCSAEERFDQHKRGYKKCKLVQLYGLELATEKFADIPLLSRNDAEAMEKSHAADLRRQGYAVWQK